MTDAQLKQIATTKLASQGITVQATAPFIVIARAIGDLVGNKVPYNVSLADYVRAWSAPAQSTRYVAKFRPMIARAHPRAADIDRDQPSFTSAVKANGNGDERTKTWRR